MRLKNMIASCKSSRFTENFDSSGIKCISGQALKIMSRLKGNYRVKNFLRCIYTHNSFDYLYRIEKIAKHRMIHRFYP